MFDNAAPSLPPVPAWRPPPLVTASVLLHLGALIAIAWRPGLWPWLLALLALNHLVLTLAGLWPRCHALGANLSRLPREAALRGEVALTIDDGPDPEVTPEVLDLLDRHDVRATFFCIGERVQAHPALSRAIARRGHAIENHSAHHRHHFSLLGPRGFARELQQAQQMIQTCTGVRPRFFRAPAGLRNLFLSPVLAQHDLRLTSWTRRGFDTRETRPAVVLRRLLRHLKAGDILLLHDGHAARTAQGRPVILEVLPELLQALRQAGLQPVTLKAACADRPADQNARSRPAVLP
ncbi:polysaccharide deacetylase family protein [Thiomonas intermedia]|uniref:polysaccharide deacetylase family protein n=1 Tax=Thiomonas intermedia TaxID=926 RepID=UPI0009A5031B|nr:polysaccharide deacetylase family protein [Thiomonas intermedia]